MGATAVPADAEKEAARRAGVRAEWARAIRGAAFCGGEVWAERELERRAATGPGG